MLHPLRCGEAAFREGICTRISPSLHLHGCAGHSPWPVPPVVPTGTAPHQISLAVQGLCAEGTLHPSCAYRAGDTHNRQTWFSSLTPKNTHRHTPGVQVTLVKLHQQVCNGMSLSSVTYTIINQS